MIRTCRRELPRSVYLVERPLACGGFTGVYTDVGRGETVVLLATTLALGRSYRWTTECLSRSFRVVTIEGPGVGRGTYLAEAWSFERYADWYADALGALSLEQVTLIGHSSTGAAALIAAAVHPRRVARLVLADSVGFAPGASMPGVVLGRTIDAALEPMLTLCGWHHVIYGTLRHTRNFFGQVAQCTRTDLHRYAKRVEIPTLVAWGRRDHTTGFTSVEVLRRLLPRPHVYVSPHGSHDWCVDRAPEFAAAVRGFAAVAPVGAAPPPPLQSPPCPSSSGD